jgi:hypothetical protein
VPYRHQDAILKKVRRLCEQADTLQKSAAALCEELTEQLNASEAARQSVAVASRMVCREMCLAAELPAQKPTTVRLVRTRPRNSGRLGRVGAFFAVENRSVAREVL